MSYGRRHDPPGWVLDAVLFVMLAASSLTAGGLAGLISYGTQRLFASGGRHD